MRWYEHFPRGFALYATPLDLAVPMRGLRERTQAAWIHTSATLSVAGNFDHFARQLGLDDPRTLSLESPFDYARQALCYLPPGLPDPDARDYTEKVIEAVLPVLQASNGRAFLLFTSHRALRRAAELLQDKVPWPLFVQGTAPRPRLLEEFRASGHGVLLGAASFWEGVDVVGEALSVVVIDKLPFAAPDDPVLMARLQALEQSGINPFMGWQVPSAVIALKQGAGRLIRDVHDRGVLVLCDPRLTTQGLWPAVPGQPAADAANARAGRGAGVLRRCRRRPESETCARDRSLPCSSVPACCLLVGRKADEACSCGDGRQRKPIDLRARAAGVIACAVWISVRGIRSFRRYSAWP